MPCHEYTVIRSNRKTLSLQVTRDGAVIVRAPARISQSRISDFVSSHSAWIEKCLGNASTELERRRGFTFSDGQCVYFIGKALIICADYYINSVQVIGDKLLISNKISGSSRGHAVIRFLSEQALLYFQKRVDAFAPRMGVSPQGISVTGAKTRWGSCSGKNRVCFSFRLICLPPELIDYVVVHELAHIREHNHSPRFYAEIAEILPDYKQRQAGLKAFQKLLTF